MGKAAVANCFIQVLFSVDGYTVTGNGTFLLGEQKMKKEPVYTIDDYAYRSPLRRWNPGWKLFVTMLVLVLGIGMSSLPVSVWMCVTGAMISVWFGRVPLGDYLRLIAVPAVFLAPGCAAIAVQVSLVDGLHLYVTEAAAGQAVQVAFRVLGAVSILYVLVLSTPVHEIVAVLDRLRVPVVVTELMVFMYRYIFVIMESWQTMRQAAESRLGYCDYKTSCRTFGNALGNLFLISMRRASRYYDALLARGYEGKLLFLEEEKPVAVRQVVVSAGYVCVMVGLFVAGKGMTG